MNYPASTTKLLTALVAVEHGKLDQQITISARAVDKAADSSSCYLVQGEQQSLEALLTGLLLVSGNDCADAIAEGVGGGDPDKFIQWMNETAQRVGASHSHFANASGLHDPNHYTTALDLALIGRAAIANPTIRQIASKEEYIWPGKSELNGPYYNHNQLLSSYAGIIAGKNGYTEQADLTLVEAAQRDGRELVGVVMGEKLKENQYGDMVAMLDMGFNEFTRQQLVTSGTAVDKVVVTGGTAQQVQAVTGGEFWISVPKNGTTQITTQPTLKSSVVAPVKAGQQLGALEVHDGDRVLGTVPLVAQTEVTVKPPVTAGLLSGLLTALKWIAGLAVGLFLFRTTVITIRRMLRRSRRRSGFRPASGKARTGSIVYRTKSR
jgi:D-alanyl-D-alanine carboxypeptidase